MDNFNNRNGVFLITGIMVSMASATIFIVPVTFTYLVAYFFTMLAIAMFCVGNLYLLANSKSYPWFVAFPKTIWQYLVTQLSLSVVFVVREFFFTGIFPPGLFVFLHIILLGVFAVKLVLIKGGKEIIETKDAEVRQNVSGLRLLQADVESIMRSHPVHEKPLRQVLEALRYSDPVSNPSVAFYEEQIQRSIISMSGLEGNESSKIPEVCETLLKQIADRNTRVKIMK